MCIGFRDIHPTTLKYNNQYPTQGKRDKLYSKNYLALLASVCQNLDLPLLYIVAWYEEVKK